MSSTVLKSSYVNQTAVAVPFPCTADGHFVNRIARVIGAYLPDAAEKRLAVRLKLQRHVLSPPGVAPNVVDEYIRVRRGPFHVE